MIELVLRTSMVLAAAWLGSRLLARATPATRHLLWVCALVSVLAAPLATVLLPSVQLPAAGRLSELALSAGVPKHVGGKVDGANATSPGAASPSTDVVIRPELFWFARAVWFAGSLVGATWFATAYFAASRKRRRGRPAPAAIAIETNRLASTLSIRRSVAVLISDQPVPFTSGVVRPAIVLPEQSAFWTGERLHAVLLHELAHIRRADCRIQVIVQIACVAYWFNPLVWLAARALRRERERACDDEVLLRGTLPSTYADSLLAIARTMQRFASPAVLPMAKASELEGRLLAILSDRHSRVPLPATRLAVVLAACLVAITAINGRAAAPVGAGDRTSHTTSGEPWPGEEDEERRIVRLALETTPEVIAPLIDALSHRDAQVREKAALGLGWRNDPRVVEPLINALQDIDPQVREKAAIALGSTGDARATEALQAALNDGNGEVRKKASAALLMMNAGSDGQTANEVRNGLRLMINGLLQLSR